jgi:nucleolar protein 56
LIETITGIFALDEENNIVAKQNWPKEAMMVAKIMLRLRDGESDIFSDLVSRLELFDDLKIYSGNQQLVESLKESLNIEYKEDVNVARSIKERNTKVAVEGGLIDDEYLYGAFSHYVLNEIARMDVHKKLSDREAFLIPAVQLLDELDTVLNGLSSRMREWYGVHFPEMGNRIREHMDFAMIISKIGDRENITAQGLMELSLKKRDADMIEKAADTSIGALFEEVDMKIVSDFAEITLDLYKYREELYNYISLITKEIVPNIAYLAGPVLAAKLIEKAGGLKKLGMMASSTIQILGAEKAMFRAVKSKTRPPKHGLLYQHPYVNRAPRNRRGNRARSLAAKIAIGARADLFSGNFIAEDLAAQLEDF